MKSIAVFCGSSSGLDPLYATQARLLGTTLARRGITLIYGGTRIGLMGAIADGVLSGGGKVIGVLPVFLRDKEIAHPGITELIAVNTMHERKTTMNNLCDGVIALPGGFGTLDELFEMLTWAQLGLHAKPIGLLNIAGYYDALCMMVQTMVDRSFLKTANQDMLLVDDDSERLLDRMERYVAPKTQKWISKDVL